MQNEEQLFLAQEIARTMAQFRRLGGHTTSWHGIRPSEFMLLHTLIHSTDPDSKGMKVSDLSTRLQITPAGVTHAINALEEGGYIERLADPADRRVVLVQATDKSRNIIAQMHSEHIEFLKGLVGFLGEQDTKEFIRLLSLTLNYFKERRNKDGDKFKT